MLCCVVVQDPTEEVCMCGAADRSLGHHSYHYWGVCLRALGIHYDSSLGWYMVHYVKNDCVVCGAILHELATHQYHTRQKVENRAAQLSTSGE